jgi:nitroreductase
MNVNDAINTKRAIRSFAAHSLPNDTVHGILNAGRCAQSAKNMQPWHFFAIQERETLVTLSQLGTYADHLANATLGVAILTPDPAQRWSIMFDAGQAAAYMQLYAWELGIGSCLATIYQPEEARQLLGFPEELHLNVAISFGYPQDDAQLTAQSQTGDRRPKDEVFHFEYW